MKQIKKQEAFNLRKSGYSLREISKMLNISQSTASVWLRGLRLPPSAIKELARKTENGRRQASIARRDETRKALASAATLAQETKKRAKYDRADLKIMCAMIYRCEGSKTMNDSALVFTNSDPELISFFLRLFRKTFKVNEERFRVLVHLHDYHDQETQLRFWSKVTNIQRSQFLRPYKKSNTGKHKRSNYEGCVSLRYHDVRIAREIQALARIVMKSGL
jgi:predicted transcriptional regulator